MSTALVRLCDTPQAVMAELGLDIHLPSIFPPRPILFSDGVHLDDDALEAMFTGQWYYDQQRNEERRIPLDAPVFINGPHLITKHLRPEWRKRIFTDRPAPFVFPAYLPEKPDARPDLPKRERRAIEGNDSARDPKRIGPA